MTSAEARHDQTGSPRNVENVFGLRRSGHHAIIEWLKGCYQASGTTPYHENSVYNHHLAPFEPHWPDPSPEDIWQNAQGSEVLIVSYEDVDLVERQASPAYSAIQPSNHDIYARDTIVVRDWFNFVASRLTYQANNSEKGRHDSLIFALEWPEVADRWLEYARQALDEESPKDKIAINYNRWFTDPQYRNQLAKRYGIPHSESGLSVVPDFGSGSSFTGRDLDGQGMQMNVLRRWEDLHPALLQRYKRLIASPMMAQINHQLFNIDQDEVMHSVSNTG